MKPQLLVGSAAIFGLYAGSAYTQNQAGISPDSSAVRSDQIEEIVITAERHSENTQKAALSVTTLSGAQLEATGVTSYADAVQDVPGLLFQGSQPGGQPDQPVFAIRGLGTDGEKPEASVSTYLDGVIAGGTGANFYDIDRVEVLRGPQGTLYGGNAPAGSVNIISHDPSLGEFAGSAQIDGGNYGLIHSTGMVNIPVGDSFALRVAANEIRRDNYTGSGPGQREFSERVKALYEPSNQLSVIVGTEQYQYDGVGADGNQGQDANGNLVGSYSPNVGSGHITAAKYYATVSWDLGMGTLIYIPAYQNYKQSTSAGIDLPGAGGTVQSVPHQNTLTQELRLSSDANSSITWISGLYFKKYDRLQSVDVGVPSPPFPFIVPQTPFVAVAGDQNDKSYAAFGQGTIPITSSIRFTGGIRYSVDDITDPQSYIFLASPLGIPPHTVFYPYRDVFHNVDGLARVEADLAPQNMVYVSFATGYRPGGAGASGENYGIERAKSYEIGSKNRFLDNMLQVNGAIYYTDYPAYQNETDLYSGPGSTALAAVVAVPTRFEGVELEAKARVTSDDGVTFASAYEKAVYTGDGELTQNGVTSLITTNGQTPPHAPRWDISASYDHDFALSAGNAITATVKTHYQSAQAVDFGNCLYEQSSAPTSCDAPSPGTDALTPAKYIQRAYTLLDSSVAYHAPSDRWSVTLYGRNLTDVAYKNGFNAGYATLGAPRTFGVIVGARF